MIEDKLKYEERRVLEMHLRDYPANKELVDKYYQARDDMLHGGSSELSDMPRGSDVSNPTERKAFKLLTLNSKAKCVEPWVNAIDSMWPSLTFEEQSIIDLYYFRRTLTAEGIAQMLNMSRRLVYNKLNDILLTFANRVGFR